MAVRGGAVGPTPEETWQEFDAEGRQFFLHGKKHIALNTFNTAVSTPGCGWRVYSHRAECKLRILDFPGALNDAVQSLDLHGEEQRDKRPQLVGDERVHRVAGLKADINDAMSRPIGRVLRRDLVRAMLRSKGINTKRLTAGKRLSWVTLSSIQTEPPPVQEIAVDTPLPLPIAWNGAQSATWAGHASASDTEDDEEEGARERVEAKGAGLEEEGMDGEGEEEEQPMEDSGKTEAAEGIEDAEGIKDAEGIEDAEGAKDDEDAQDTKDTEETKGKGIVSFESPTEAPRWGWLKQIPGHAHICADPMVAAQAERVAELRVLGILDRDRTYLRKLLGDLHSVKERPGTLREDCGCPPCPGPNLTKWQDYQLRTKRQDDRQDPLALSKWRARDLCVKTLDELNHMVKAELRCKPRYLQHQQQDGGKGPSPLMRAQRTSARQKRTLSTVMFMMRRLHGSLGSKQYRDAEQVGERLTAFLERLPCRVFADRLDALARALDCRALAARRMGLNKVAIDMQKRRCALAVNHGMAALYVRALDELGLLLFSVAEYQLAETSWCERLARLHHRGDKGPMRDERVQALFQLARCCFVQGAMRMAGAKQTEGSKKDHRVDLLDVSVPAGSVPSETGRVGTKRARASDGGESTQTTASGEEMYSCEWWGACRWTVDLLGYDVDPNGLDPSLGVPSEVLDHGVELKPNSVEACLRMIMDELDTKDPLGEYTHLLAVERYPDEADASRTYRLMPPDFDLDNNVMNREYETFECRFRDACDFLVNDITGRAAKEQGAAKPETESEPMSETKPDAEPEPEPEPETDRLPSVSEEPEDQPPASSPQN